MSEKYYDSSIKISSSFGVGARLPLDARTVCDDVAQMNSIPDTRRYEGMKVYVIATKKEYRYNGKEFIQLSDELVINNLESEKVDVGLSAKQGKVLKGLIDTLDNASTNLNKLISELKTELGNAINANDVEYKKKFSSIEQTIININNEISKLKESDASFTTKISSIETTITSLNKAIESLKSIDATHTSEIDALKKKDTAIDSEISNLKKTDESINKKIIDIENSITTGVENSGKIKIDQNDTAGYMNEKLTSGTSNHKNGVFKVDYNTENGKYKSTVSIPLICWEKL